MGEKTARRLIACGWIIGTILGALTVLGALFNLGGLNIYNLVDAAIMLGLAYGTYRESRICAGLALLYYVTNQITRLQTVHSTNINVIATVTVFFAAYVAGVVGTFALHAKRDPTPSPP